MAAELWTVSHGLTPLACIGVALAGVLGAVLVDWDALEARLLDSMMDWQ
jgi:hypothetical protein